MNAIACISVAPYGTGNPSLSKYVAQVIDLINRRVREKGMKIEHGSMVTTIEGPIHEIFTIFEEAHCLLLNRGLAQRVGTTIRIDQRTDKEASIAQKNESIRQRIAAECSSRSCIGSRRLQEGRIVIIS
jgi:uncharacterized protein (TIGR00106 family)